MKEIVKSLSISLELTHYYTDEVEKYERLTEYVAQVKADRNKAQDILNQIRTIISQDGFAEESQKNIKELLDIE